MPISRKIIISEISNILNAPNSQMRIRDTFNVGVLIDQNKITTTSLFDYAETSSLTKKFISSLKDETQTLPIAKDTYEYSSNFILNTSNDWNNFVSSSLSVTTSDHYTILDGMYDTKDAYYLGLTQAVYSANINYEYNFLIESYEKQISKSLLDEKLLPNMYVIMYAKTEQEVTGQQKKFNNIITLNNRINSTETYSLQNKPLTNLNAYGEYHDVYANAISSIGTNFNISSLNNIRNVMTNVVIPPEQLSLINQMSEYKELYPMYNEINITMDKFSSFSSLLKDSGLTLSLINYVINNSSSVQNFFYNEEGVSYNFDVDTDNFVENNNKIFQQGIITTTTSSLQQISVPTYDILNWWQKTKEDFTPSQTNNKNTLVLGIDDESLKITQKDYEFARNISYLIFYGKLRKMVQQTQRNFSQTISGEPSYSEAVFYKINKYKSGSTIPLQTFWIPNSADIDTFQFIDTQVKYNTEYEYKIFAYTIVIGSSITTNIVSNVDISDARNPVYPVDLNLSNLVIGSSNINSLTTKRFNTTIEYTTTPLVTLVEVPIYNISNKIVDDPPLKPEILVIPNKNINNKIKFYLNNSTGQEEEAFQIINTNDSLQLKTEKTMYSSIPKKTYTFKSDDIASSFEIYRIQNKPNFYSDFDKHLIANVTTDYDKNTLVKASSASFIDNILPNTKYYYIFRTTDYHGNISNPTDIYEIEMVDDDGAIYLRSNVVKLENNNIDEYSKERPVKKLFYIKPEIMQTLLNNNSVENINEAYDIYTFGNANILGQSTSSVWDKKFKLRFISKKTGKMFDLNLQLNVEIDKENL